MRELDGTGKLYRYFHLRSDLFSSITDLPEVRREEYADYIQRGILPESHNDAYFQNRVRTEVSMRELFIKKGGKPQRVHPYYFTLGNCDKWFFGEKDYFGSIAFDIEEFELDTVSFTYGDSIPTFMDTFDDGKEYRKNVYTYAEILQVIEKYGFPQEWNSLGNAGPENYIEVQVWSEKPIGEYRTHKGKQKESKVPLVEKLAGRIICAKEITGVDGPGYTAGVVLAQQSRYWNWFCCKVQTTPDNIFTPDPIHGKEHACKCALYALLISAMQDLEERDCKTLVLAAFYHDIGRMYNENGKSHGTLGAENVKQYLKEEAVDIEKIQTAIYFHDKKEMAEENKITVFLRDVDTLNYLRLGIGRYRAELLRTPEAKRLLRFALEINMLMFFEPETMKRMISGE